MTRFGIQPRFVALVVLALCLSLLSVAFLGSGWGVALVLHGLAVLAAVMDHLLTPGARWFRIERRHPAAFEQNNEEQVELIIHSDGPAEVQFRLVDTPPETFRGGREVVPLTLQGKSVSHTYRVLPTCRGVFSFGKCYLEARGRWGLSVRRFSLECPGDAPVLPNLGPMRHYRMLAERRQLWREDSAIHRIRGIGTEFVGIREYSQDDDWSKVNWKATARTGKLMTNVYDAEKNREVILAVDTGRWMQAETGGVTRLDRALEMAAAIMQVALSSGDRVGLVLYGAEVSVYLEPSKGSLHAGRILQALYEARPGSSPASFSALSAALRHKLTRRAFVCVFTYLDNPQEAAQAVAELAPVRRRHSLYLGSLTDEGLESLITKEAAQPGDLYLKAAAAHRKSSVLGAVDLLRRNGIGAWAGEPGDLLARSVRQYLVIRGRPL